MRYVAQAPDEDLFKAVRDQLVGLLGPDELDEIERRFNRMQKHLRNAHATIMHDDDRADLDGRKRRGWTTYVAMNEVRVGKKGRVLTHLPGTRKHRDEEPWSNQPIW